MEAVFRLSSEINPFEDDSYRSNNLYGGNPDIYPSIEMPVEDGDVFSSVPFMFGDTPYPAGDMRLPQAFDDIGSGQYCSTWDTFDTSLTSPSLPFEEMGFAASHNPTPYPAKEAPCQKVHSSFEAPQTVETRPAKRRKTPKCPKPQERPSKSIKPQVLKFQTSPSSALISSQSASTSSVQPLLSVFDSGTRPKIQRKYRSGFTEEAKKKVDAVRAVGACIQCKFRKRTCGTSHPCLACKRRAGNTPMAMHLCTRESPFDDLSVTEFYSSSSRKRVVDFKADFTDMEGPRRIITIDGTGRVSRPLHIIVVEIETANLSPNNLSELSRISKIGCPADAPLPPTVTVLDPDILSPLDLEQWAIEYTYRFNAAQDRSPASTGFARVAAPAKFASSKYLGDGIETKRMNPNATSFLLGLAYVEQGLPYSNLVANMVKMVALNFILYNGVNIIHDPLSPLFTLPTIKAQIDTKLFQCMYNAEKNVYQALQRLIFKSAGQLTRDALVPVCLSLWLLTRLQCIRASHLMNLRPRNAPQPIISTSGQSTTSVSHQRHTLNLLLSTFTALFRSSMPLLLDFEDKFNADLLGGDEELIQLAKMLKVNLLAFKKRGYIRAWRKSMGYTKEEVNRIRALIT